MWVLCINVPVFKSRSITSNIFDLFFPNSERTLCNNESMFFSFFTISTISSTVSTGICFSSIRF